MTIVNDELRANMDRLATFFDSRTNIDDRKPKIALIPKQMVILRRNPAAVGAVHLGRGVYSYRGYKLEAYRENAANGSGRPAK